MIGYVVLHYVVLEETKKCIESLKKVDGEKRIVIVDNFSPNESGKQLQKMYEKDNEISIIITDENLGFAKANNLGFTYIFENFNCDFIVVMNNDIEIVQSNFDELVRKTYVQTSFGVLGPDVFSTSLNIHQSPKSLSHVNYESTKKINEKALFRIKHPLYVHLRVLFKEVKILNRLYHAKKQNSASINYEDEQFDVVLHGSFLIFSQIFTKKMKYPFFGGTFFYYESEILDYFLQEKKILSVYNPEIKVLHHQNIATKAVMKSEIKRAKFSNENIYKSTRAFLDYLEKADKR